jgi:MFS family permease
VGPLYVSAAGYSTLQVGYLLSVALAGSTGMTILVGVFSDRYGRKPLLITIATLAAIGSATYALTDRFWVLALMAALASIRGGGAGSGGGFGPFYPAEQALVAGSSADRHRNAVFSSLSLIGVLAAAVGSAVAVLPGILREHFRAGAVDSYHPIFWISAVASLAIILLTLPIREKHAPPVGVNEAATKLSARSLIGRLWLTNGLNGLAIGVMGPFLTYWFALRYGAASTSIATLYTLANLLTAASYLAAPRVALRLGAVRVMFNSIGMPIRQSFIMGVAEEQSRSKVAAMGSLPSRATAMVTPAVASHLIQSVSVAAPIWLAAAVLAVNAGLFQLFFKNVRPPEEN